MRRAEEFKVRHTDVHVRLGAFESTGIRTGLGQDARCTLVSERSLERARGRATQEGRTSGADEPE